MTNTTSSRVAQFRIFTLVCASMWGLLAVRNSALGRPKTATVQAMGALVSISAWYLSRVATSEHRLRVLARVALAGLSIGVLVNALLNGAMTSTPFVLAVVPSMAAYILGVRDAVVWAILTFLGSAGVIAVGHLGLVQPEFHQGPWEFVVGGFLPLHVSLLVLAVASRRATDAEIEAASLSEARIRKQSDEIALARDAALQAGRAKSAFLATMSHELRTPLNAIIGMSSVIDETQLTQDQRECIATIRTSGDALLARISDILDFSKIEAGKIELESAPVELSHCIEDAIDLVAPAAAEKGVEMTYEIADAAPAWIMTDRARVQQILLNLLSNAVKFTARGDVSLAVDARRADDGGYEVEFKVTDEGIGIPAEKMGRLFGTFSQVDASTTRQYGGTGLGLAISKALVTLLGGKIGVDSEEGRGSTFSFTIRAGELADGRPSNVGDPPPSDVRAKRVLVLTGNGRVRDMVVRALTSGGAVVTAVASLSAKTAMGSWDAGIVDLGAGREGDVRVAESFRKLYPEIPVVLLMPLGRHDARLVEFVKAHGMATVAKPIKPARLLHALARGGEHESLSLRAGPATGGEPHGAATTPRRVLVVDDSNINQKVHRRLLEELGHSVDVVDDGLEAIQAVGRRGYDVVFLDLQMPGLDGFETARRLVARWPAPQRPRLIALTANVGVEDRDACIAAGMDGYLSKPVRLSDVQAAMRDVPVNPRSASTAGGGVSSSIDEGIIDSSAVQGLGALESHSGEPFLSPLIDQFFGEAPKRLADLEGALARGDARAIELSVHSMKGTAAMLGAVQVAVLAATAELTAKAGDLAALDGVAGRLREAIERAEPMMRKVATAAVRDGRR